MEKKRTGDYNEDYGRPVAQLPASQPANRGRGDTYGGGSDGGAPVQIPRRLSFKEAITKAEGQIGFHEYSRKHA